MYSSEWKMWSLEMGVLYDTVEGMALLVLHPKETPYVCDGWLIWKEPTDMEMPYMVWDCIHDEVYNEPIGGGKM